MRIRLTLRREPQEDKNLAVTVDGLATVGDIATELYLADPSRKGAGAPAKLSLLVEESLVGGLRGRTLPPESNLLESGLRPGATVALTQVSDTFSMPGHDRGPAVATLRVVSGPDQGREFALPSGTSYIGRDFNVDVRLSDPMTSKRHARINVGETIEIVDTGSANGLLMEGAQVSRAVLGSYDEVTLGDSTISIVSLGNAATGGPTGPLVEFNRSPRVVPHFKVEEQAVPAGPQRPRRTRFPMLMLMAPILMGAIMYSVTQNLYSLVFIAMMPLMMIGSWVDQRANAKRDTRDAVEQFRGAVTEFRRQMTARQQVERAVRLAESPSAAETVEAIYKLGPLLWTHRPEHPAFLSLRLGVGRQPSRTPLAKDSGNNTMPEYMEEIAELKTEFTDIDAVPVVAQLRTSGALGIAGPRGVVDDVARALVLQAVGLHSPAELAVAAMTGTESKERWQWLQWLPHVGSVHSPLGGDHLAAGRGAAGALLASLEDLLVARGVTMSSRGAAHRGPLDPKKADAPPPAVPALLVIIEDDVNVDRARLTRLTEYGADVGVHILWVANSVEALPAACRDFLQVAETATTGQVRLGQLSYPVSCESVDAELAGQLARMLAPVVDAGKPVDDDSDLPRAVSYVALAGHDLVEGTTGIADRWLENNSVAARAVKNRKHQGSLRALVGSKGIEPMYLDLKTEGPHALVGGTTGAGKSEFLQSWVLGMAAAYSPDRLSFLFVDYKGGAAFADCVQLPHTVGLVTDLSPHLVRRALTSLRAELHYREHLLNRKKAKDLLALEREADPEAPPSLVIVVDEFAALAKEVPEFVDGVVDVAARGRSLGLHLILATQRPSGVIKDSLRANTNMRIALRMADVDDSNDILGEDTAAYFSPSIPGRGAAKTGPGRIEGFQTGYAGGWTSRTPERPRIDIVEMDFGAGAPWEQEIEAAPVAESAGPNDIARVVANISLAAVELGVKPPRKPWLGELSSIYDFSKLPTPRNDQKLLLGVMDDPAHQAQPTVFYEPDRDGNMAILGASGSGKSAALRTIAVAAAITPRGGPVQVYGIDAASNGLQMLEVLPHVGGIINAEDGERVGRLLRYVRGIIDERAESFAQAKAGSISEYRRLANRPDEPRIIILLDGLGAFRELYEFRPGMPQFETLQQIATDGRPMGVHIVVAGDSTRSLPTSLASSIQRKLVLRMATTDDYVTMGLPKDVLDASSPPGRGMIDGGEIQLAIFGGTANLALQARQVASLGESMRRQGVKAAPRIESLPEILDLDVLPTAGPGHVTIGADDYNLEPAGLAASGALMLTGPPGSGRTTALVTLAEALKRSTPGTRRVYFGSRRSAVASLPVWDEAFATPGGVAPELRRFIDQVEAEGEPVAFFIEGVTEFSDSPAEMELVALVKAAVKANLFVVGEAETSTWSAAWNISGLFKAGRRGLLLNPGDIEGDTLMSTPLGRTRNNKFVPGRGYVVGRGKAFKLQVATTMDHER
ncbi:S-DNA-T family DNA segregation ATPase FtsK/SpoIIIE [Arthrobacter stackebrandtii]|uniref:S-DNA-T family DNA segregation ATPase FtsK/SpoIIIE n=1 Tax=Arthrobacter stackebrandtii TaxID=272161 RepID=A0ABS4YSG6_9MICC|nr:FtsK/SpoIIIE domain-containing protein [Arthrobacter stackebrandtii]MBP2411440.1 S-DNA-T family DNA segregation ATPase FtsK/SpoIIIE [Arthrobacter stackebrandtii]PYH00277.1 cell division protein FtsK [Arthrobacter stackebrandtii]